MFTFPFKMGLIEVFCLAVLLLGSTCFVLAETNSTDEESRYIIYDDYEYHVKRVIDLQAQPESSELQRLSPSTNTYLLYTRKNPTIPQTLVSNSSSSVNESNYNPSDQTVVIVHGWKGNQNSQINPTIRDAYLDKMNANIIVVDWSPVASSDYVTATRNVPGVGRALGNFLEFLDKETGASFHTMHLIGFSLGAHVVGNAGKYLRGRVARLTGLDPAGPLWGYLNEERLSEDDAVYTETIHTDSQLLGTSLRSGAVDFYPNGGYSQPGCALNNSCSHNRSWQLFAATVTYDHLLGRKCTGEIALTINQCHGEYLPMGNVNLLKDGCGQFRLNTNSNYPFTQIS